MEQQRWASPMEAEEAFLVGETNAATPAVGGPQGQALAIQGAGGGGNQAALERLGLQPPAPAQPIQGPVDLSQVPSQADLSVDSVTPEALEALLDVLEEPGALSLRLGIGLKIKLRMVDVTGMFSIGGSLTMSDDRRFRTNVTLGLSINAEFDAWIFRVKAGVALNWSFTNIYESERHFAEHLYDKIMELMELVEEYEREGGGEDVAPLSAEEQAMMSTEEADLSDVAPTWATSTTVQASLSGTTEGGTEVAGTATNTATRFTRQAEDGSGPEMLLGETQEYSASLSGDGYTVTVTYSDIQNNANTDNNGQYLNVQLEGDASDERFSSPSWVSQAAEAIMNSSLPIGVALPFGEKAQAVLDWLNDLFTRVSTSQTEDRSQTGMGIELNLVANASGGWSAQYTRIFATLSHNTSTEVPISPVISGVITTNATANVSLGEFVGVDTLTYFQTVYNGLNRRTDGGEGQWRAWAAEHRADLVTACQRIAQGEGNIATEASPALLAACQQHASGEGPPSETAFQALVTALEMHFAAATAQANSQQNWITELPGRYNIRFGFHRGTLIEGVRGSASELEQLQNVGQLLTAQPQLRMDFGQQQVYVSAGEDPQPAFIQKVMNDFQHRRRGINWPALAALDPSGSFARAHDLLEERRSYDPQGYGYREQLEIHGAANVQRLYAETYEQAVFAYRDGIDALWDAVRQAPIP
ncbi:MAG: hypothetical protein AAFV53_21455 [Myxococcota bacterium]